MAASEEEELAALLAQAEALRREAESEEQELQAERGERQAAEARAAEEEAQRRREQLEKDALVFKAQLKAAEARLVTAEREAVRGAELRSLQLEVLEARRRLGMDCEARAPTSTGAPPARSQADWEDLARRLPSMSMQERVNMNKQLGPQGRRKLAAVLRGEKDGVFIIPGARVRLLEDQMAYAAAFRRFKGDKVNGLTDLKRLRRGQDCTVRNTFQDRTLKCVFDDGMSLDFPWEAVEGIDWSNSQFV